MEKEILPTLLAVIESFVVERPDIQKTVAKTLLGLLKIRKTEKYDQYLLKILAGLEMMVNENRGQLSHGDDKVVYVKFQDERFWDLAAVAAAFAKLDEGGVKQLEQYLGSLAPALENSLEKYLAEQLKCDSGERNNPTRFLSSFSQDLAAMTANFLMGSSHWHEEDFCLNADSSVTSEILYPLILEYYQKQGYELLRKLESGFWSLRLSLKKGKEGVLINVTLDQPILITVMRQR